MKARQERTLERLVEAKREALEPIRADLIRLNRLCDELQAALDQAIEERDGFLNDLRAIESRPGSMLAGEMMHKRRYLEYLTQLVYAAKRTLTDGMEQRDQAHQLFETRYTEIRALERLGEKRHETSVRTQQRLAYSVQDDVEIIRRDLRGTARAAY